MCYNQVMKYLLQKNKIIIQDTSDFNIEHILKCGQIFTYKQIDDNTYEVYSKDEFAKVEFVDGEYIINCTNEKYFENFFDLKTDYSKIKNLLCKNEKLIDAINYGYGIRVLNQNILEVIIGFIISSNNNIKRITSSMAKLRQYGEYKNNYYAFPTLQKLSQLSEEQFKEIGVGYRASYLVKAIKQLENINLEETFEYDFDKLKSWLLSLCGVGPKVADCIMLFGYHKSCCFPVDTWIEKVYIDLFGKKVSRQIMAKDLTNYFGDLSGYAQQYLFFYKREN